MLSMHLLAHFCSLYEEQEEEKDKANLCQTSRGVVMSSLHHYLPDQMALQRSMPLNCNVFFLSCALLLLVICVSLTDIVFIEDQDYLHVPDTL